MKRITRRKVLGILGAGAALALAPRAPALAGSAAGRVVVVGGGFGGASAAKYLKRRNPALEVTLVEPAETFYTCPFSNWVLGGLRTMESIGHGYDELTTRYGVRRVKALAEGVDTGARTVTVSGGERLAYDRLVLSPGIDIRWGALEGYDAAAAERAPHAWKAGEQTLLLRRQLEAMDDGGLFVLVAPDNPFRCPPGPYERVSLIAHYLSTHKPRSKVLVLDAKDAFSKQGLFMEGWKAVYGDRIEWVSRSNDGKVVRVDAGALEVETEFGSRHHADVLNVVPPQQAGRIAALAGTTNESGWVPVHARTFESAQVPGVYVVGDATIAAPLPKSGFAANAQAKVAAAAIVASLAEREAPEPYWANTCYSLIAPGYGISVAGVYHARDGEIVEAPGGGVSPSGAPAEFRALEAEYAVGWYQAIAQDIWGTPA
jgi:sulfide dehydrogenase [flavocytochrome c] flavoprotein chain